ncbi:MAG: DUF4129 domain-containing protein [Leptospirales bacterium]|nr:DUF4129 domain-containing protein [Leptospirales bacterium]
MKMLVFSILLLGSASKLLATPPGWTKEMPWYDQKKETYREYTAEDIKPYLGEENRNRGPGPSIGGMPDMTLLIYSLIAILIGIALYFAARYWMERGPRDNPEPPEQIDVSVFPDDMPEAKLPEQDLRRAIEELLLNGNVRRAGMLLFQLTLKILVSRSLLEISPDQTPREIQRKASLPDSESDLLHAATGVFEECAYKPAQPELQSIRALKERVFALNL